MSAVRGLANVDDPASLSNRMRSKRFALFASLIEPLPKPLRVLDIGGTNAFWKQRGMAGNPQLQITTLNLKAEDRVYDNITPTQGDATAMPQFADNSFDLAFSNSVIEHLFTRQNQQKMASEIARVAPRHWIQTPNFWFPVEPHFHMPGWQWWPRSLRIAVIRRVRCGWNGPHPDPKAAAKSVDEVRLLTRAELARMFPDSTILPEKFKGLVKSWVAIKGLDLPQGVRAI